MFARVLSLPSVAGTSEMRLVCLCVTFSHLATVTFTHRLAPSPPTDFLPWPTGFLPLSKPEVTRDFRDLTGAGPSADVSSSPCPRTQPAFRMLCWRPCAPLFAHVFGCLLMIRLYFSPFDLTSFPVAASMNIPTAKFRNCRWRPRSVPWATCSHVLFGLGRLCCSFRAFRAGLTFLSPVEAPLRS